MLKAIISVLLVLLYTSSSFATSYQYTESTVNFANPERGWFVYSDPVFATDTMRVLTAANLQGWRASYNSTLVHRYYLLKPYVDSAIPQSFLDDWLIADLNLVRSEGFKLIIRFTYNYNQGFSDEDTDLARVLDHIEQIRPIFAAHSDVIYAVELGFIGKWGEMHGSTNSLIGGAVGNHQTSMNQNSQDIVAKMLDVLPKETIMLMRYPYNKILYLFETVCNPCSCVAPASNNQSSIGYHMDAWAWNETDANTWSSNATERTAEKSYVHSDALYVPVIVVPGEDNEYARAQDVVNDIIRLRISAIDRLHFQALDLYQHWIDENEYDSIEIAMGYRYVLVSSEIPDTIDTATDLNLNMSLEISNVGGAGIYNARKLEIILRKQGTGEIYTVSLEHPSLATVLPFPGATETILINKPVPSDILLGTYDVLLNLPDASSNLEDDPDYSIQLGNINMWEAGTGYNDLAAEIIVQ